MDKYQKSLLAQGLLSKNVTPKTNVKDVPIAKIMPNRNQPRQSFNQETMEELSQSIRTVGVIEPIIVRPMGDGYEIVVGERRFQAVKHIGYDKIPCIIRNLNDTQAYELSLVENIQRDDLNPIEEATAYKRLMDEYGYTYREFKRTIGKSEGYINERIQLLNLPDSIKNSVFALRTRTRHARHILKIKDNQALQSRVFNKVIDENLTHENTADLVSILENDAVPQKVKDFVINSKAMKPLQARSVIDSGLPEKSAIKVMKNIARRTAGKTTPLSPDVIEKLVKREKTKLFGSPEVDKEKKQTTAYFDELRTLTQHLLTKLEPNAAVVAQVAAQKIFAHKMDNLRKELEEFLSLIKSLNILIETEKDFGLSIKNETSISDQ